MLHAAKNMTKAEAARLRLRARASVSLHTYRLIFSNLDISIKVEILLHGLAEGFIEAAWRHEVFPKNLPAFLVRSSLPNDPPDFSLYLARRGAHRMRLLLMWHNQTITYSAEVSELAEDLSKIVLQTLAAKTAHRGLVIFHASALATESGSVLIPGPSGTGKSTTALWWMASGRPVIASETAIVSKEAIHGGNLRLSIKRATAKYYLGGCLPKPLHQSGEYLMFDPPNDVRLPSPVKGIVFVKLTEAESRVREVPISPRRASMMLYEAAYWIPTGGFLLGGQLHPAVPILDYRNLQTIARVAICLAEEKMYWIEGGARAIGDWLASRF